MENFKWLRDNDQLPKSDYVISVDPSSGESSDLTVYQKMRLVEGNWITEKSELTPEQYDWLNKLNKKQEKRYGKL